ncbi:MAG: hypothetical protein ACFFAS_16705 [Promethearchaeota archaeon]
MVILLEEEKEIFISAIICLIIAIVGLFVAGIILGGAAIGGSIVILIKTKQTESRIIGLVTLILGIIDIVGVYIING